MAAGYIVHFARKSNQDYSDVDEYLKSFETWCSLSSNNDTWIVLANDHSAGAIRRDVAQLAPNGTHVFVLQWAVSGDSSWFCSSNVDKWMSSWFK